MATQDLVAAITINAHTSIRVAGEKVAYFDPFKLSFPTTSAPHDADVVFVTHSHYDHFSPEDIAQVAGPGTIFVMPASMVDEARAAIPALASAQVVALVPGQAVEVAGMRVEAVAAYNPGKKFHPRANDWLGYVMETCGARLYVCGDMDATPEGLAVSCDVVCVPCGGTYTMDAREAADFVNELRPAVAIPTHYGSIVGTKADGSTFAGLVDPAIEVALKLG